LNEELGFNLKVISGYQDAHEIYLAVDRREVDARATDYSGVKSGWPQWLKPGAMNVLVQFGRIDRHPDFPNVPTARELAPTPQAREIIETDELPYRMSRPFAAPPGTPAPIAAALRSAFMQAMKNPELRAQATKMGLGITPISGQEVEAVINRMRRAPKPVLDQLRRLETAAE
jgi:tripartite-type tricarboxylate transporter receptor subunit TctC